MISHKLIGIILLILTIGMFYVTFLYKQQVDDLTTLLMTSSGGQCIQNGICIHEQSKLPLYIGFTIPIVTLILSIYFVITSRYQKNSDKTQQEMLKLLHQSKKKQSADEKFALILKALNEDEKKVMKALHEQDGIEQATLRIRTDLSKTKLSVVLSGLEKKNLVKKVPEGKKNKIYLKTAF